jgi:hypothetical protein
MGIRIKSIKTQDEENSLTELSCLMSWVSPSCVFTNSIHQTFQAPFCRSGVLFEVLHSHSEDQRF